MAFSRSPQSRRTMPRTPNRYYLGLLLLALSGVSSLVVSPIRYHARKTSLHQPSVAHLRSGALHMSSQVRDPEQEPPEDGGGDIVVQEKEDMSLFQEWMESTSQFIQNYKPPPLLIEDQPLLIYDIMLIINLSASISFWSVHRMDFNYMAAALSEGSLISILWILAGLSNGIFLNSAIDGHKTGGGPKAAGLLALSTFLNAASLRIIIALVCAMMQHRAVGMASGEDLMVLETWFGVVLMSVWRYLHSSFVPRM